MDPGAMRKVWQDWNVPLVCVALKLALHFLTNTNYGFHRDEFLYLAIGERLAWGYMEVPPVIAVFGKLALSLGGQLFVVRLFFSPFYSRHSAAGLKQNIRILRSASPCSSLCRISSGNISTIGRC